MLGLPWVILKFTHVLLVKDTDITEGEHHGLIAVQHVRSWSFRLIYADVAMCANNQWKVIKCSATSASLYLQYDQYRFAFIEEKEILGYENSLPCTCILTIWWQFPMTWPFDIFCIPFRNRTPIHNWWHLHHSLHTHGTSLYRQDLRESNSGCWREWQSG